MGEDYENMNDGLLLNFFGASNGTDYSSETETGTGGEDIPGTWPED